MTGRALRWTRALDDLEDHAPGLIFALGGIQQRAQRVGQAAILANDAAGILRRNAQLDDGAIAGFAAAHLHLRGVIHQALGHILDQPFNGGAG